MKYTLLELTQDILSSMDSDEINSINDTVEAQQVVTCIKTVYDDIVARSDASIYKGPFNLTSSGTTALPVIMTKPANIDRIDWIKYNCYTLDNTTPAWKEITFVKPETFLDLVQGFNPTESNVSSLTYSYDGFNSTIYFKTDRAPCYYTSFDDTTMIFESYDVEVDSTLQTSKTLCFGSKKTTFEKTDSFTPNLQPGQFSLLLNEAKSLAWSELKQMAHQKAEQSARRNWTHIGRARQSIPTGEFGTAAHPFNKLPSYGRK